MELERRPIRPFSPGLASGSGTFEELWKTPPREVSLARLLKSLAKAGFAPDKTSEKMMKN